MPTHKGVVVSSPDADDPSAWVTRSVPILPMSEQYVALRDPKSGEPLRHPDGKLKLRLVKFDVEQLEELAAKANEGQLKRNFLPVHIGHTDPKEKDETLQPEHIGFLRNHRVGQI